MPGPLNAGTLAGTGMRARVYLFNRDPLHRCHICKRTTTLELDKRGQPLELSATVEHLFGRHTANRKGNLIVLACHRCNSSLGVLADLQAHPRSAPGRNRDKSKRSQVTFLLSSLLVYIANHRK